MYDTIEHTSNIGKVGVVEFFSRLRQNRLAVKERDPDTALKPVDRCPSWVIPSTSCVSSDPRTLKAVETALQRLDPDFRIVYDPLTAVNGGPGFHLYRVERNAWAGGHDKIILEMSVQRDPARNWPFGGPCVPGPWFVDFVRTHMKPHARHSDFMAEVRGRSDARELRERKRDDELRRFYYKDVFKPVYVDDKLGRTGTSKDLRRNRHHVKARDSAARTRISVGKRSGDRRRNKS